MLSEIRVDILILYGKDNPSTKEVLMKKLLSYCLAITVIVSTLTFASTPKEVKADDLLVVSNVTTSTAHIDFRGLTTYCYEQYGNVQGAQISVLYIYTGVSEYQVIYDDPDTYVDYVDLSKLPEDTHINVMVKVYYLSSLGDLLTKTEYVSFYTTMSAPKTPTIKKATMIGDDMKLEYGANGCTSIEYKIMNNSSKTVKSGTTSFTSTVIYNMKVNTVYSVQIRGCKTDRQGNKKYSAWSAKKYVVPQPNVTSTKRDVKVHYINIKWKKVSGAQKYEVSARVKGTKKFKKVATVKGTKYVLKKLNGKTINTKNKTYEFRVVTIAQKNGKTVKSTGDSYYYAYTH